MADADDFASFWLEMEMPDKHIFRFSGKKRVFFLVDGNFGLAVVVVGSSVG